VSRLPIWVIRRPDIEVRDRPARRKARYNGAMTMAADGRKPAGVALILRIGVGGWSGNADSRLH
jgi:hypothetical protein